MADSPRKLGVLASGLAFGEGPRWHERRLWLSDMHAHHVVTVDEEGRVERVVRVAGESFAARLTAFDVAEDGGLSNRRVFAKLEGAVPDGICLDAEGCIWLASPPSKECLRVREGGEVLERIPTETQAIACMLGGAERRTLFVLTAETTDPDECRERKGSRVETASVDVPGAGLP